MIFNKVVYVAAPKVQLAAPSNFLATPGTGKISLTWTDPEDIVRTGRTVATWAKTRIVRKEGAPPNDHNDGVIVVESTEKNQYQSAPYYDSTVQVGTVYHYGAFSYSEEGVWGQGAFASGSPIAGTPLGEIAEGTLIKIQENGAPVEFYLAKHNYEPDLNGQGRELLVRKDVYDQRVWATTYSSTWENSDILSWLNSTYKSLLDADLQEVMGITAYQYTPSDDGNTVATRSDAVFLLSLTELGKSATHANKEGTALPIASTLQIAYQGGSATTQWTRSPITGGTGNVWWLNSNGNSSSDYYANNTRGSRPCFTLPSTAFVDADLTLIES